MPDDAIQNVAVLGLGTMGHGIVQAFAFGGLNVRCFDPVEASRASAIERIAGNLEKARQAEVVEQSAIDELLSRIEVCDTEAEALEGAEFVTEAAVEELEVKQEIFGRVESKVTNECILASNTSTFPMTQIAAGMKHPERAIDTHWFNPPHIVPLVEVIPGKETSEQTTETTLTLLQAMGKLAVRVRKEVPGFIANRVQIAMYRELLDLLERGVASAEDIDRAMRGSIGFRMAAIGPLQIYDFAGIDIHHRVYSNLVKDIRSDREVHDCVKELVADGNLGVKTGKGIFEYTPESIKRVYAERDSRFLDLVKLFYA